MLWFNYENGEYLSDLTKFQYILCYGSTALTSLRSINFLKFQYILCYGSTNLCS